MVSEASVRFLVIQIKLGKLTIDQIADEELKTKVKEELSSTIK